MLDQIKQYRYRQQLQKGLKQLRRKRYFLSYEKVHSLGLLFNATDLDHRKAVIDFADRLKNEGKRVSLLGYFDHPQEKEASYEFRYYDSKSVKWGGYPTGELLEDFMNTTFDLFLHLHPTSSLHTDFVAALSKAHYKVGPVSSSPHAYDLMIEQSSQKGIQPFMEQVLLILKTISPTHEAA